MRKWFILLLISVIFLPLSVSATVRTENITFDTVRSYYSSRQNYGPLRGESYQEFVYPYWNNTDSYYNSLGNGSISYKLHYNNDNSLYSNIIDFSTNNIIYSYNNNGALIPSCPLSGGCNATVGTYLSFEVQCESYHCGYSNLSNSSVVQDAVPLSTILSDYPNLEGLEFISHQLSNVFLTYIDNNNRVQIKQLIYTDLSNISFYFHFTDTGQTQWSYSLVNNSNISAHGRSYFYYTGEITNGDFINFYSIRIHNYNQYYNNIVSSSIRFVENYSAIINFEDNANSSVPVPIPDDELPPQTTDGFLDNIERAMYEESVNSAKANSFFSNFNNQDNGGISSIITAPLTAINSMLSNQCSSVVISVYNKNISLPCGSTFWDRQDVSNFKVIYNTIIGGYLCYCILRNLFILIHQMKEPDNDRVEVMDL